MLSRGVRIWSAVSAVLWLTFPGFGLTDLSVSWSEDWQPVSAAAWGLFAVVVVALPFVLIAIHPRRGAVAVAQLVVAAAALAVAAVVGQEWDALVMAGVVVVQLGIVALGREVESRSVLRPIPQSVSQPWWRVGAVGLAVLGLPWLVHAWQMSVLDRGDSMSADITMDVDHYTVLAALDLSMVALAAVAALVPRATPLFAMTVGVCSLYLGAVSFTFQDVNTMYQEQAGGFGEGWSVGAMLWGAAWISVAMLGRRATAPDGAPVPIEG